MPTPFPPLDGSAPRQQQFAEPPEMGIDTSKRYTATMETSLGTIVIALDAINAPITVNSFVFLAAHHYYDGVIFHRIVPNFVCQGGDPTGTGGGGPGYRFQDEPVKRPYEIGSVAMANSGRDTNGSQFFFVGTSDAVTSLRPRPDYNHFGQIVKGLDVLEAMQNVAVDHKHRPHEDVVIHSVTITVAD